MQKNVSFDTVEHFLVWYRNLLNQLEAKLSYYIWSSSAVGSWVMALGMFLSLERASCWAAGSLPGPASASCPSLPLLTMGTWRSTDLQVPQGETPAQPKKQGWPATALSCRTHAEQTSPPASQPIAPWPQHAWGVQLESDDFQNFPLVYLATEKAICI